MSHFELQTTRKGSLYSCECANCGVTMYAHEWAHVDNNDRRDAMQAGTLRCDDCAIGVADPATFQQCASRDHAIGENMRFRGWYACRYSAPGYLDCTDWHYGTNRRALEKEVRNLYNN